MNIRELINRALFYVTVPKCVLCKEKLDFDDRALCKNCFSVYESHKKRNCPKCANVLNECFCTYDYLESHGIKNLVKLFRYSQSEHSLPSNYLIYSLKQDNRKDVFSFFADELATAIRHNFANDLSRCVITNVPRRNKAIVDFGYDHAKILAMHVADVLNIEYVKILKSKSKKPQKSVYGNARISNAKFEYNCKKTLSLKGKIVILVDDIVTTGASMINCATLIRGLKPKKIVGACLGTAYKEEGVVFNQSASK